MWECILESISSYIYQCPLFTRGGAGQSSEAETTEAVVGERSGRDREQAFSDALRGVVAVVQRRDARVADLPHFDLRHLVGDRRLEAPRVAHLAALGEDALVSDRRVSRRVQCDICISELKSAETLGARVFQFSSASEWFQ